MKNRFNKILAGAGLGAVSLPSFALDEAAITAAVTAAESATGIGANGVVAVVAVAFGIGMIIMLMRKV